MITHDNERAGAKHKKLEKSQFFWGLWVAPFSCYQECPDQPLPMISILNRSGRQQDSDPCSLPMDGGPCRALKPRFVKTLSSRPNHLYFVSFSDQSLIIALPCQSVTESLLVLDFAEPVVEWICQNWYMDFSKLLHGFVKIDEFDMWISLSCYMDRQSCLMYFLPKFEVWLRF